MMLVVTMLVVGVMVWMEVRHMAEEVLIGVAVDKETVKVAGERLVMVTIVAVTENGVVNVVKSAVGWLTVS